MSDTREYLVLVVYAQPAHAETERRNWLTTVVVWPGTALDAVRERAIYHGVRQVLMAQASAVRLEMHYSEPRDEIPAGKCWDAPDWTNGDVRMWNCPSLGDLAPAVGHNSPPPGREPSPYGHRHAEEQMR